MKPASKEKGCYKFALMITTLGMREALIEWYMFTEEYQKIIRICDNYPEDMLANIAICKVLAYCYQDKLDN